MHRTRSQTTQRYVSKRKTKKYFPFSHIFVDKSESSDDQILAVEEAKIIREQ